VDTAVTLILQTARTRLREFNEDDLDNLANMVDDDEQMRFYPRPKTRGEASAWIKRNISLYKHYGFGFWFIESALTGDFVGYCGIRPHEQLPEIEIGWHTNKKYWSQGLATEAARACRDLAFDRFALDRLIGIVDPRNVASVRVAEKIGMRAEHEATFDGYRWVVYAVERGWILKGIAPRTSGAPIIR
jgi:RimJ/RimL family protein N-acetyltransferase